MVVVVVEVVVASDSSVELVHTVELMLVVAVVGGGRGSGNWSSRALSMSGGIRQGGWCAMPVPDVVEGGGVVGLYGSARRRSSSVMFSCSCCSKSWRSNLRCASSYHSSKAACSLSISSSDFFCTSLGIPLRQSLRSCARSTS